MIFFFIHGYTSGVFSFLIIPENLFDYRSFSYFYIKNLLRFLLPEEVSI